ncbi:hypothetical protein AND4_02518 [Vibrio sp. AND4]|nr:hypothetical protein AND4_02518 [Vibrio sp. AND4]
MMSGKHTNKGIERFAVFSYGVKLEAQILMEASGFGFVDLFT